MPDSVQQTRPLVNLLRASWESTRNQRGRFFLFIFLFISSYVFELLIPWALGYAIDAFVKHGVTDVGFRLAGMGIAAFLICRMVNALFHHFARYVQTTVAYSARMSTLIGIFKAIFTFPLHWHTRHHSGDNLSKLHRSAGAIDSVIGTYTWLVIEGVVKTVFATAALFALDVWVACNVIAMGCVTIFFMVFFNKRLTAKYRQNNTFSNKINRICIDYLFNVVTVKTLGLEKAAGGYLEVQRDEGLHYTRKIAKYSELKWGTTSVGAAIVMASSLMLYFYKLQVTGAPFEVQPVYVLMAYLDKIFQAIGSFTGYYGGFIESATAYEDGAVMLRDSNALPRTETTTSLDPNWNRLSFHDISFSYVKGEPNGLHHLSLDIDKNDKIAVVGPSGGGKSTFLKIVGGLILPESGSASSDIQDYVSLADVAKVSLLVPQEPEIFSESLRYNLTMGEEFPPEEIAHFIKLGRLEGVLEKLPHGELTNMAEKGLNLSVGEKQRVAMVRGLLRISQKQILLLDEPTSSLDPKTEKAIFLSLLEHFKDRVIMTACHRLNIVPLFDKIVYVRDGTILESGSFSELIRKGGAFADAWEDYERRVPREILRA